MGIEALTLDGGGSVESLDIDFTLPGYPYIELKVNYIYTCTCTITTMYMYNCATNLTTCTVYVYNGTSLNGLLQTLKNILKWSHNFHYREVSLYMYM